MAEDRTLHERLIARQSDDELKRKSDKSEMRKGKLYTQEELDHADREAQRLYEAIHWSWPNIAMPLNKPSDIVKAARVGAEAARRIGMEYKLDERRLGLLGFSQSQIDDIFNELEHLEAMDRIQDVRYARLDAAESWCADDWVAKPI
jgi:hypothetical protein